MAVWSRTFNKLHGDHSAYINDALKYGLKVYSCEEVSNKYNGVNTIKTNSKLHLGGFSIQAIPVKHSCECYAYIIDHNTIGRIMFITDCSEFNYRVKGINHLLIEANYDNETLESNLVNNQWRNSLYKNHLCFEDTLEIIKQNYSPELKNIILLHLSKGNSNEKKYIENVGKIYPFIDSYVANGGLEVDLNKEDF
ncbi:MAG: hypothetical protein ACI35S_06710 [Anaeroplasma sp.]